MSLSLIVRRFSLVALVVSLTLGCGAYKSGKPVDESRSDRDTKISVQAFLYDAKIRHKRKPTSVRLEIFKTDSVAALAGRGYIGKGALKGRWGLDSLLAYFPASNEYIYEPTVTFLSGRECRPAMPSADIMKILDNLPESLAWDESVLINQTTDSKKKRGYLISMPECNWTLELDYDLKSNQWLLKRMEFDDGRDLRLSLKRRKFKARTSVRLSRFEVAIPANAIRLTP